MTTVSMFEAKTNLSRYVASVADRHEPYVIIVRNGKPVAKIVPYTEDASDRIGIAKGKLPEMGTLEEFNQFDLADSFLGDGGIG